MNFRQNFINELYKINESNFNIKALSLFNYQYAHNPVYKRYVDSLKKEPEQITSVLEIPFLPVTFYKSEKVLTGNPPIETCFYSSGTTGKENRSKHYVSDLKLYENTYTHIFNHFYGPIDDYIILALLPSYQENKESSLLYMINDMIQKSNSELSSFISTDFSLFLNNLDIYKKSPKKKLLMGVAYALIELAEQHRPDLSDFIVMETGGMKGRRREMVKSEMHDYLKTHFNATTIHSEYGMTELLSQAYAKENGIFECPSWMKVLIRQVNDPFDIRTSGRGAINIIDLANIDSCAFIEIQDLANLHSNRHFEILGRMDNSEMRGCNLLYA